MIEKLNDEDAQPLIRTLNSARLNDRMIDELVGACRGVLFDGVVTELEANALLLWLESNKEVSQQYPANVLYRRISRMMEDGHLDPGEEKELLETLIQITGDPDIGAESSNSSTLPLCSPAPEIKFQGQNFCFTGKFVSGTRKQVQAAVTQLGNSVTSAPTRKTTYLVIGSIGSSDWIHSTHGRKIEKAIGLRESTGSLRIVSEEHWVKALEAYV